MKKKQRRAARRWWSDYSIYYHAITKMNPYPGQYTFPGAVKFY